ncbi:hypothetical protein BHF71_03410 [Vulcanibacillus modesticaldus]|uniref:Chemotaxis protein n=1 Tax=Vulcanibacillus modesticaldus TaxID=337097 RepID=A0A1D2YSV5_9BACI|nr:cache domain-containing protein [Vulcanibacillus modesticaldus]OEF98080.1 hypothetical protein BHF71_03410 [Vulcanibacillus modesticaldus]
MKSLRAKLTIFISVMIIVVLSAQGITTLYLTQKELENNAKETLYREALQMNESMINIEKTSALLKEELLEKYDQNIKNQVENVISILNYYYQLSQEGVMTEEEAKKAAIDVVRSARYGDSGYFWIDNTDYILLAHPYLKDKEGKYRGDVKDVNGKLIIKELVDGAKNKGEVYVDFYWTKPGKEGTFKKRGYAKLFEPWGWVPGTGNYVDDITKEIDKLAAKNRILLQNKIDELSKSEDIVILDKDGKILYYTNKKKIGTKLNLKDLNTGEDILTKILNTDNDYIEYTVKDYTSDNAISKIAYVLHDDENQRYVLVAKHTSKVYEAVNYISKLIISILIVSVIIAIVIVIIIARKFTKPILALKEVSRKVSSGDLSSTVEVTSKDELGELQQSFNDMIVNLRNLTAKSSDVSKAVEDTSKNLAEMIGQITISIEQVSTAVEDIASNASNQALETEQGVKKVTLLEENTNMLYSESEEMKKSVDEMKLLNDKGKNVVDELKQKQELSKISVEKIKKVVTILNEQIESINVFTTTISDIANQTNLLALNAAIEAARVGEQGKGFAVVADEIRKLAEESNQSATEIHDIVVNIINDTKAAMESVAEAAEVALEQDKSVNHTHDIFMDLNNTINTTTEKIENVYAKIKNLEQAKNDVVEIINNINIVTEETAATTEEVSASVEEQNASMEEINSYVQELAQKAKELKQLIELFKL